MLLPSSREALCACRAPRGCRFLRKSLLRVLRTPCEVRFGSTERAHARRRAAGGRQGHIRARVSARSLAWASGKNSDGDPPFDREAAAASLDAFEFVQCLRSQVGLSAMRAVDGGNVADHEPGSTPAVASGRSPHTGALLSAKCAEQIVSSHVSDPEDCQNGHPTCRKPLDHDRDLAAEQSSPLDDVLPLARSPIPLPLLDRAREDA